MHVHTLVQLDDVGAEILFASCHFKDGEHIKKYLVLLFSILFKHLVKCPLHIDGVGGFVKYFKIRIYA